MYPAERHGTSSWADRHRSETSGAKDNDATDAPGSSIWAAVATDMEIMASSKRHDGHDILDFENERRRLQANNDVRGERQNQPDNRTSIQGTQHRIVAEVTNRNARHQRLKRKYYKNMAAFKKPNG